MPLVVNGSHVLGPSASSSITTLPAYLASIGKDSFYARFVAGTGMYVNADKTGGAVALDGAVGSWGADPANTNNFTAYFTQSVVAECPPYATANGIDSLYAAANSGSDPKWMELSSTSALNGAYTVIARHSLLARDSKAPYSHNGTAVYWVSGAGGGNLLASVGANGTAVADQVTHVVRNVAGTSSGNCIIGVSQTGTGHNGFAPRLLRRTSSYSATAISEIWFMPVLTDVQLDAAMSFIT